LFGVTKPVLQCVQRLMRDAFASFVQDVGCGMSRTGYLPAHGLEKDAFISEHILSGEEADPRLQINFWNSFSALRLLVGLVNKGSLNATAPPKPPLHTAVLGENSLLGDHR